MKGREGHIGGSDASACVGMNPYKDNVQLWVEKRGLVIPEDLSGRDYVSYGTEAETYLRSLFAMDFPQNQVSYEDNNMFLNTAYPWMHAYIKKYFADALMDMPEAISSRITIIGQSVFYLLRTD